MGLLRAAGVGLSAAGVVLLICRWALLPMTKEHSWVQYLGIGLAIGGSVVFRSLEGRLPRGAVAAAAVLGAALG
ncbi:MAG: hypothetical protein KJO07_16060, partial [Deltaproteobacteria bacterium]|nr:hypothetical protein [Deltaproteobacteria bacterium]